jgi:hypothetical protein
MANHLYLAKANDDLVSHCRCARPDALISSPCQMDCPWCGCGWLFICSRCRKAFTFAQAVEVNETWEQTADRTIRGLYQREPKPGQVEEDPAQGHSTGAGVCLPRWLGDPDHRRGNSDRWLALTARPGLRSSGGGPR